MGEAAVESSCQSQNVSGQQDEKEFGRNERTEVGSGKEIQTEIEMKIGYRKRFMLKWNESAHQGIKLKMHAKSKQMQPKKRTTKRHVRREFVVKLLLPECIEQSIPNEFSTKIWRCV